MKTCEYCNTKNQNGDFCEKCGAILPKEYDNLYKPEPFFYNGYICYAIRHPEKDTYEIQFWLGVELQERIELPREFINQRVLPCEDVMPFFWEMFLLAHGEIEVIKWQEVNKKYPAAFEVRRIENKELERQRNLTYTEAVNEFVK